MACQGNGVSGVNVLLSVAQVTGPGQGNVTILPLSLVVETVQNLLQTTLPVKRHAQLVSDVQMFCVRKFAQCLCEIFA